MRHEARTVVVVAGAALTIAQVAVRDHTRCAFAATGVALAITAAVVTVRLDLYVSVCA